MRRMGRGVMSRVRCLPRRVWPPENVGAWAGQPSVIPLAFLRILRHPNRRLPGVVWSPEHLRPSALKGGYFLVLMAIVIEWFVHQMRLGLSV
jgi:hypothetical protein